VWVIVQLLSGAIRRDVSARLLFVPVLLFYGITFLDLAGRIALQLGWSFNFPVVDVALAQGPFPISLGSVIDFIFILALLVFLMRRFSLARKEEERMAGEFEAAKTVQSLLIPAAPPVTVGFTVETVYLPALEVGGDFFQVSPGKDGSLLIVVGDVSGKGLKAAMTVSTIVGALRGCTVRTPADVLAYLNRALHGQVTGFFTCCVALVEADGKLTIANAGHLPPYLNGEELAVADGLPLGIADEGVYTEIKWRVGASDRLTFVSDGVVEARNASGELYGFGRTKDISGQPAEIIARAAQRFGQDDDITVLTVAWTPELESVPT
jgi:serine phosphatase RsbU (regulator of sigma subunit)